MKQSYCIAISLLLLQLWISTLEAIPTGEKKDFKFTDFLNWGSRDAGRPVEIEMQPLRRTPEQRAADNRPPERPAPPKEKKVKMTTKSIQTDPVSKTPWHKTLGGKAALITGGVGVGLTALGAGLLAANSEKVKEVKEVQSQQPLVVVNNPAQPQQPVNQTTPTQAEQPQATPAIAPSLVPVGISSDNAQGSDKPVDQPPIQSEEPVSPGQEIAPIASQQPTPDSAANVDVPDQVAAIKDVFNMDAPSPSSASPSSQTTPTTDTNPAITNSNLESILTIDPSTLKMP